jgi:ESS family glutamate:Na+ symporter
VKKCQGKNSPDESTVAAIVFGFPMMLLATMAPERPLLTLVILIAFFAVMNIILFRSFIFRKKK